MSLNSSIRGSIAVFRSYKPILRPRLSIFVGNKRKYERKLCTRGDFLSSRSFSSSTAKINDETLPHSDGLTRYPSLSSPQGVLRTLDWLGTISFAASGTLCAGHAGLDALGCIIVGTIASVGGGTIRDAILHQRAFWVDEYEYILLCLATCGLTLLTWKELEDKGLLHEEDEWFWWSDTLGVGAFACVGAQNAIRMNLHPVISILCGMFTATFGGVVRDTLCKRDVRILNSKSEIYATTALSGATMYNLARAIGGNPLLKIGAGMSTTVALRYIAAHKDIKLPLATWRKEGFHDVTPYEGHRD